MPDHRMLNKVVKYKPKGRKSIDRPRRRWMDETVTGYMPNPKE
jgi:hypothetical protein